MKFPVAGPTATESFAANSWGGKEAPLQETPPSPETPIAPEIGPESSPNGSLKHGAPTNPVVNGVQVITHLALPAR